MPAPSGGEEPDVAALRSFVAAVEAGAESSRPSVHIPEGHELTPLQSASIAAWGEAGIPFAPTFAAARADGREQLRRMHAEARAASALDTVAMHQGNKEEMDEVKRALRLKAPSTLDPEAMAAAGGYPGLTPVGKCELRYTAAPPGHVRALNHAALASTHAEHCTNCRAGEDCFIWSLGKVLEEGVTPAWAAGPTEVAEGPDYVPEWTKDMEAHTRKWVDKGVIQLCEREDAVNPTMAFIAVAWSAAVEPGTEEAIRGGGVEAREALMNAAQRSSEKAYQHFIEALRARGGAAGSNPRARDVAEAWKEASLAASPHAKTRLVIACHDLNSSCAHTRFSYERLADFLAAIKPGWWFAKLDLRAFFYTIRVNGELSRRLVYPVFMTEPDGSKRLRYAKLSRMCMGHANSPFIACLVSGIIHATLRARMRAAGLEGKYASFGFVDDFGIAGESREVVGAVLKALRALLEELHIDVAEDKSTQVEEDGGAGEQAMVFLGVQISSVPLVATLPPQGMVKVAHALMVLKRTLAEGHALLPANALARASGLITRLLEVAPNLAPFTRRAVSALRDSRAATTRLSHQQAGGVLEDINLLLSELARGGWDPAAIRLRPADGERRILHISSDFGTAGMADGVGVYIHGVAACCWVLMASQGMKVADGELSAVALFLVRYGSLLRGWTIRHASDALGVIHTLQKNRAAATTANNLLALITSLASKYGVRLHHSWLSRYGNTVADRLAAGAGEGAVYALGVPCGVPVVTTHVHEPLNTHLEALVPGAWWCAEDWGVHHERGGV